MANVDDVAAALLESTGPVTAMKLQKLVYYCQAWHLAFSGEPLFADRIEAWAQGPVTRSIYQKHRRQYTVRTWPSGRAQRLEPDERRTVTWVLDKYAHFSAESLSRMTHIEIPWRATRGSLAASANSSEEIPTHLMRHHYARQLADVESAVAHAAANAAMEGVDLDAEWQDVLRSVANGSVPVTDAIQAEIERARASE